MGNLVRCSRYSSSYWHQEQVPRKQGLKLIYVLTYPKTIWHQEQVPRKQGLKLFDIKLFQRHVWHQEQVPRKQGLKPTNWYCIRWSPVHQEQVPRKQGLKLLEDCSLVGWFGHQEQVPRKQGLKLGPVGCTRERRSPSRASSTKTRIETINRPMTVSILKTSRASSTKTRIETNFQMSHVSHNGHQEQVPRKQGLKPDPPYELAFMGKNIKSKFHENKDWNHFIARFSARIRTSRASSTKTRIETRSYVGQKNTRIHQEQVPRKQGLKRPWAQAGAHTWRMENQIF